MRWYVWLTATMLWAAPVTVEAATLSKTYSYFSIGGATPSEIERELNRRGPQLRSTGQRHPGATRMEFKTNLSYREGDGRCAVVGATVELQADMILPRWRGSPRAGSNTRMVWEALSSDIRRHEERHVEIARDHAREMEAALRRLRPHRTCKAAEVAAKRLSDRILGKHDRAQARFDEAEARSYEERLRRLIRSRGTGGG